MFDKKIKAMRKDMEFVLLGGEIEYEGKIQKMPGLIEKNEQNYQLLSNLNQAILALARIQGVTAERFDRETADNVANIAFMKLLSEAGQKRASANEEK